ncbi:MAG TPA: glycoside hydrolase family 2, partial [Candidatus Latescibacteria bacterium]|nr:glycoside hydrolase family 2 [Candidatus Latescibacterota bacterium]
MVYSLDGEWLIACDPRNEGRGQDWWAAVRPEACLTNVPWIIQGVFPGYHGVAWYWRQFSVHRNPYPSGRYLLRFWAVDYLAEVWVNGQRVGAHEGAETPFVLDITEAVVPDGKNLVAVRVLNPTNEPI